MRSHSAVTVGVLCCIGCVIGATSCTALLGGFDVATAPIDGGDLGGEGGLPRDGASDVATDGPVNPPPCAAPKIVCGGTQCVDTANDEKHCGACGRSCFGGMCVARRCLPALLFSRPDVQARTLLASDTDLFFGTTTHEVMQVSLSGEPAVRLAAVTPDDVYAIAQAGPRLYFTVGSAGVWDTWSAVTGMNASGQPRKDFGGGIPRGLAVAGANLYTMVVLPSGTEQYQVVKCPLGPGGCVSDFQEPGRPGNHLAAGGGMIFWTDALNASVYALADIDGKRVTMSTVEATPEAPAWDGTRLFWANNGQGTLRASPYPIVASADFRSIGSSANDVAVDGAYLYYSQNDGLRDHLYAVAKAMPGVPPLLLATGSIGAITQNQMGVFWANDQGIYGVRKP